MTVFLLLLLFLLTVTVFCIFKIASNKMNSFKSLQECYSGIAKKYSGEIIKSKMIEDLSVSFVLKNNRFTFCTEKKRKGKYTDLYYIVMEKVSSSGDKKITHIKLTDAANFNNLIKIIEENS